MSFTLMILSIVFTLANAVITALFIRDKDYKPSRIQFIVTQLLVVILFAALALVHFERWIGG